MKTIDLIGEPPKRKPPWLKVRLPSGDAYEQLLGGVRRLDLHTVCQEAMCPNIASAGAPAPRRS